jgi:hypothetical protein
MVVVKKNRNTYYDSAVCNFRTTLFVTIRKKTTIIIRKKNLDIFYTYYGRANA